MSLVPSKKLNDEQKFVAKVSLLEITKAKSIQMILMKTDLF
jgi:hypothetical protein